MELFYCNTGGVFAIRRSDTPNNARYHSVVCINTVCCITGNLAIKNKNSVTIRKRKKTTYFTYLSICVPLRRTYVAPYLSPFGLAARK